MFAVGRPLVCFFAIGNHQSGRALASSGEAWRAGGACALARSWHHQLSGSLFRSGSFEPESTSERQFYLKSFKRLGMRIDKWPKPASSLKRARR